MRLSILLSSFSVVGVARAFVPVTLPTSSFVSDARRTAALNVASSGATAGEPCTSTSMKIAVVTVRAPNQLPAQLSLRSQCQL